MVTLYDSALVSKLEKWTNKSSLHVFGPNKIAQFKKTLADESNDKSIKLPVIALSRDGYRINNTNKTAQTYNGAKLIDNKTTGQLMTLNCVPITIEYNLDIYTRYLEEADAYMRELIFNLINYPSFDIVIPYMDTNLKHTSNIRIASDNVVDNSDSVRIGDDQIVNLRLQLDVDDAYMWDTRVKAPISISAEGVDVVVYSTDTDKVIEPVVIDYNIKETN